MKNTVLIFSIILLSILLIGTAYIFQNKDICCRYGLCRQLTDICIEQVEKETENGNGEISIRGVSMYLENLKQGDEVEVGTEITGRVTGSWYFEGVFPVRVFNQKGEIMDTLIAQSSGEWMTEDMVNFSFVLDIDIEEKTPVLLRLERTNPADFEENDDYVELNIVLIPREQKAVEMMNVKVFFPNSMFDEEMIDCSLVFPVTRSIERTQSVGRAALEELLKGLTQQEKDRGYFTNINDGVIIQSLTIEDGVAKVDLNSRLEEEIGGSCKVASITAQITETLKQFPTVDSVIISIDGRTEDILQP